MEDRRLSLNYDVRGPGPSANRAGAGSGHPACVSQLCDDWRRVYIPTSFFVVSAEATVSDEDVKVGSTFCRSCLDDSALEGCRRGEGGDRQFGCTDLFGIYGWIDDGNGRNQCPVQSLVRS